MVERVTNRGFTLIETIAVLVIAAVVSAIALNHLNTNDAALVGEVDVLKGHLRYAQIMAMKSDVPWGVLFSANSYTLLKNVVSSSSSFPNENSSVRTLPSGVTVNSSSNPIEFDQWGSPGTSNITVTVTAGSSASFIVARNTGFIP
jgi:prepilin-type N-terminal cleavage/methylation domain-containing protein